MSSPRGFALRVVIIAAASTALMGQAHAGVSCHKINAKGVGQSQPVGASLMSTAKIQGGGLLQGTTSGIFNIIGGGPPPIDFAVSGLVVFTANKAKLTASLLGTFNGATGKFLTAGPVTSATGKLAGATGDLTLEGVDIAGNFTETVTGEICVDLKP